MYKRIFSFLSALITTSVLTACGSNSGLLIQPDMISSNSVAGANETLYQATLERPDFNRKANGGVIFNSFASLQRQQLKLHTFFFKYYADEGSDHYSISDKNPHMKMLLRAEVRIGEQITLDPDFDGKVTFDEIKKFITSKPYIADYRAVIVTPSFTTLDKDSDKILSYEEFSAFNKEVKAKEVDDFDLDKEMKTFDYNFDKSLTIEEYEDFFMKYLLIKLTW
jgi:hypothetical protein